MIDREHFVADPNLFPIPDPELIPKFSDRGSKKFEMSNHLGNVLAVVSDKKLGYSDGSTAVNFADYYDADLVKAQDYYPESLFKIVVILLKVLVH